MRQLPVKTLTETTMTTQTPPSTEFSLALFRWQLLALVVFTFLFFVSAPYGRFYPTKSSFWWGPAVDGRFGWMLQELASPIALLSFYRIRDEACLYSFPNNTNTTNNGGTVLVLTWFVVHYAHRAIVWPWRRTMGKTNFPVVGACLMCFCSQTRDFNKAVMNEYPRFLSPIMMHKTIYMVEFLLLSFISALGARLRVHEERRMFFARSLARLTLSLSLSALSARVLETGSAILFNFFNGKFIASELRAIGGTRRSQDDLVFKLGLVLALSGALVNVVSDEILLRRRRANTRATPSRAAARRHSVVSTNKSSKYILPNGFFFDYVLCPNYLGEFIEWLGLAVATNNLALRAFALWTFANLFPRAVNYRRWYVDTFGEKAVGKHRKAFLPFLV